MLEYRIHPMTDTSWCRDGDGYRSESPFSAPWSTTLDDLERELRLIRARDVVIEVITAPATLTRTGTLRSGARVPPAPAVLAFDSRDHGPLIYRCDKYMRPLYGRGTAVDSWQHNVRAITQTLEAQRALVRWGAAGRGEAYTGWKALPAGTGIDSGMTATAAQGILARAAGMHPAVDTSTRLLATELDDLLRYARKAAHPDMHNGDRGQWNLVDNAEQVLRRSGWLPARQLAATS